MNEFPTNLCLPEIHRMMLGCVCCVSICVHASGRMSTCHKGIFMSREFFSIIRHGWKSAISSEIFSFFAAFTWQMVSSEIVSKNMRLKDSYYLPVEKKCDIKGFAVISLIFANDAPCFNYEFNHESFFWFQFYFRVVVVVLFKFQSLSSHFTIFNVLYLCVALPLQALTQALTE